MSSPSGSSDAAPAAWPAGGGEMGALMRATDWSQTGLGPIAAWPQSLRTMVGVVLGSRFPFALLWGPELRLIYNDAYRPILRDKHPAALAAPAGVVWAEVWDVAGPMARGVLAGGPATWTEDLQLYIHSGGRAEETYFTFSYSPVPGDDGEIGGVLNTVQETTGKVQLERQLRMLHDLSVRASGARTEHDAYRHVAEVLADDELDVPFVLLYAGSADGAGVELVAAGGWRAPMPPPARIPYAAPAGGPASWPLAELARTGRELVVDDVAAWVGAPIPPGTWGGVCARAIVLPLARAGAATPLAFMVAGVSPHRELDDAYRLFFGAVVAQASATVTGARVTESERKRAEALEPARRVTAPAAPTTSRMDDTAGMRVLIVEDDPDLRDMLADRLRTRYRVATAVDGQDGLEAARRQPPDLVLCDVVMPRLDGLGLLQALRADKQLAQLPFILLSARGGEALVEALDAGADDYLVKPISGRELLARVRIHLALARPRDVFERFFQLSLDMTCIAGIDGYFRRVSPAFSVLGYTDNELITRPFIDFVHPDDVAATLAEVEKLAHNIPTIHFENRYRCADGTYRWLSWTAAPDGAGTLYAIARDITETRRIQDALRQARDEAEAANRELESFSYSVAHDLRSPLRSIDGFSQALLEDYADKLDAEGHRYLGFVRESAQQMAQLIDDLLGLSRVTRSELQRADVDLSALARATIARLQRAQPARAVAISIEDGLHGEGDPRLLAVVLDNLLGNAWKFTSQRADAHIAFGATTVDRRRAFFVGDNGAGFDMAFSGKLFGVFQRLHAATEFEGTGVGLATVHRVITRHGGKVWAEGAVGHGATFYFTLGASVDFELGTTPGEGGHAP